MTTETLTHADWVLARFARLEARGFDGPLGWLLPVRKSALAHFAERGFPTTHDEDWHYTNVAHLSKAEFVSPAEAGARVTPADLRPFCFEADGAALLVFVNGRYAEHLSSTSGLPAGVRVMNLAEARPEEHPAVERHLARHALGRENAFVALNTALAEDGAFVHVARGVNIASPIHLLHVTVPGTRPTAAMLRNLMVGEEGSEFTVVESYVAAGEGRYFNNVVTELVAGPDAQVKHAKVVRDADEADHIAMLHLHQERGSHVSSHTSLLGGMLLRNDIHAVLDGADTDCQLHGLYQLRGSQQADNHLKIEHRGPRGASREVFRGILDGKSHGTFSGRIIVHPAGQRTDAKQTNMNLLLSDGAQASSKPQLEIHADDVKCTHGSTTGQVDEDAIFYLRSRGVPENAARSLLVHAFARASLEHVPVAALRAQLERLVLSRLPSGENLEGW